ncbi:BglG family transcription antiterminator [Listeria booriae]|uniref:BglG family transcription antiterminator n=1 Tax=Listeria booriae TaxID=1552123 RepID=UPI001627675F|nr:BglG family transcription antiterminator [Listeria booriae]MBC2305099.1 BglG family transcription antiterminator [Listeria booriae]
MLNQRQKKLLRTLYSENNWMHGKKLATLLQVSDRTIRNDIRVVKEKIGQDYIFTSKKLGYAYNVEKAFPVDMLEQAGFEQERMAYLMQRLLAGNGVDIYEFATEFFVSESTVQRDIHWLRGYVEQFVGLDVRIQSSEGIYTLQATPRAKIELFNRIIKLDDTIKAEVFMRCFTAVDQAKIEQILQHIIDKHKIVLKYFDEAMLRMQLIYCVDYGQNHLKKTAVTRIPNSFLKELFETIQKEAGYGFSVEMQQFILEEFDTVLFMNDFERKVTTELVLNDRLYQEILAILEEIKYTYLIDFTSDLEVTSDMTKHIFIALERSKRGIFVQHQVTHTMIQQYSYLLDIAIFMGEKLLERMGVVLNQEEITLLVMYLYQYYRKIEAKQKLSQAVRLALVVLEGKASLYYLREQLKEVLKQFQVEIIEITDSTQYQLLVNKQVDVDLCISTKQVDLPNGIQCIVLPGNIGLIEEVTIKKHLMATVEGNRMRKFVYLKEKYLHEALFLKKHELEEKYEAMEVLSRYCIDKRYVPTSFTEKLYNREQLFSTAIPTGIALPHPIKNMALKSGILICILEKPSKWDAHKISLVMIPMIRETDGAEAPLINDFLSFIASKKAYVDKISRCNTYLECMESLQAIYSNVE